METLAINGGPKTIQKSFPKVNHIGNEEKKAVNVVLDSGNLSEYLGVWHPSYFYGGHRVQEFESHWSSHFKVKHSIAVNSATSGLITALGALELEPGDEVIVSPWTMSASSTSILVWNAIPVFADIDANHFNLNPEKIKEKLSDRTRAIMVPNIFGRSADLETIMKIASDNNLRVIEDAAQSIGASYKNKYSGTIGDIGVFSLNYHKHIHTGEGGVCVTNDDNLAERMQLIRNHGESVVIDKGVSEINNIIGFNFRLTEIQGAMGIEQLKKLPQIFQQYESMAHILNKELMNLKGLEIPELETPKGHHSYYVYPMKLDFNLIKGDRKMIVDALIAEGVRGLVPGYTLSHLLPIYQKKIAYGKKHFPWSLHGSASKVSYELGICPVAEELNHKTFLGLNLCSTSCTEEEIFLIAKSFAKVWDTII